MRSPLLLLGLALILLCGTVRAQLDDDDEATVDVEGEEEVPATPADSEEAPHEEVPYITPEITPDVFFAEHFDDGERFDRRWIKSRAQKDAHDPDVAKYDGEWSLESSKKAPLAGDKGLVLKSKAKHAAIAAGLTKPFQFDQKSFIVQYEINFQNGQDCGGGYIKLLSQSNDHDLTKFNDKTPYTIMFGPDKCGSESKLHFIFRHVNPKNGTIEEKHCKKVDTKYRPVLEEVFKDNRPHLFSLELSPDNTFKMFLDHSIINHGSLLHDFTPAVNPPAEIDDLNDKKPQDWDEREKIPDPTATKPEDWDESEPRTIPDESAVKPSNWLDDEPDMIPDSEASRPEDWDDDMDGEWEAPLVPNPECANADGCGPWVRPMIDNPKYKGKWVAPMINNPAYKGKWKPRKIPNPEYFHDPNPFKMTPIHGVGIEIWSMSDDIFFDNILITDSETVAKNWAADTFDLKVQKLNSNNANIFRRLINYSNKNPWLYAVYVVVVGLPLVLIFTFCCSGDSSSKQDTPSDKHAKKTDEVVEDDQEVDEDGEASEDTEIIEDDSVKSESPSSQPRKRRARKE